MRSTFPRVEDPEQDRAVMMSQRYKMVHSTGRMRPNSPRSTDSRHCLMNFLWSAHLDQNLPYFRPDPGDLNFEGLRYRRESIEFLMDRFNLGSEQLPFFFLRWSE